MKKRQASNVVIAVGILCLMAFTGSALRGKDSLQDQKVEMGTFYLCLLVKGPIETAQAQSEVQKVLPAHLKHLEGLAASGKAVALGPFVDNGRIAGVVVINAASAEEARALEEADPMVKTGHVSVEVLKWWAAKGIMKPPSTPLNLAEMKRYYFGLISRGPNWTAQPPRLTSFKQVTWPTSMRWQRPAS